MHRPLLAACAVFALAACATPTHYAPANPNVAGSIGFSEYRIENNRYRVTFQGGQGATPQQVNDYTFLRAAEITLRDGYDWFQVIDRFGEQTAFGGGPTVSIGGGTSSWGGHGWGGSGVGVGIGTSFPIGQGSSGAFSRTIEIVMGRGARPASPDVYDARQVAASLAPGRAPAGY